MDFLKKRVSGLQQQLLPQQPQQGYGGYGSQPTALAAEPKGKTPVWFTLAAVKADFDVCNTCMHTFVNAVIQTVDTGTFATFTDTVRTYDGIPACPRDDAVVGAQWHGWPEALLFCPECWVNHGRASPIAARDRARGTVRQQASVCSGYSPRLRQLYATAHSSAQAWDALMTKANERYGVYQRTYAVAKRKVNALDQLVQQGLNMQRMAVTMQASDNVAVASGGWIQTGSHGGGMIAGALLISQAKNPVAREEIRGLFLEWLKYR